MEEEEGDDLTPSPHHQGNPSVWGTLNLSAGGSLWIAAHEASTSASLGEASGGMAGDGWCCLILKVSWMMAQEKRQNPGEWQGKIQMLITCK